MTLQPDNNTHDKQLESLLRAAMNGNGAPATPQTHGEEQPAPAPDAPAPKTDAPAPVLTVVAGGDEKVAVTRSKAAIYDDIEPARPNSPGAAKQQSTKAKDKSNGKPAGKKTDAAAGKKDDGKPSFRDFVKQQANEDYSFPKGTVTLRKILGGDILDTSFVRKQIWVMLIITAFIFVYISNRYSCQRYLITIDKLNKQLVDAKYKALSTSSQLTERSRESHVLEMLKNCEDSTLHIANQPPYIINVPDDADNLIKQ